jgi:methionine synthase / methylenetetrahydrofolate reductase (NADH)
VAITGDPPPTGPYPDRTAVFDLDSIGLTNLLDHFNRGLEPGGQSVEPPTSFVVGVVFDQGASDLGVELSRFRRKVEAGADFALTQPVFDVAALAAALEDASLPREIPVLAGVCALGSLRDAEYLSQEVPGVQVPGRVLDRMAKAEAGGGDAARTEGIAIGLEIVDELRSHVQGVHVVASRGDGELALALLREVTGREEGGSGVE